MQAVFKRDPNESRGSLGDSASSVNTVAVSAVSAPGPGLGYEYATQWASEWESECETWVYLEYRGIMSIVQHRLAIGRAVIWENGASCDWLWFHDGRQPRTATVTESHCTYLTHTRIVHCILHIALHCTTRSLPLQRRAAFNSVKSSILVFPKWRSSPFCICELKGVTCNVIGWEIK